jgi:pyruvate dehydrogenase E2 component (dihydrolipoamide acetyltransferase)
MPDLGVTGGEVTLIDWLVGPGQQVKSGQPLFQVETDKAVVEVESFRDGFVRALLVDSGHSVPIGGAVAVVADSMEEPLPAAITVEDLPQKRLQPESAAIFPGLDIPSSQESEIGESAGRIVASPLARQMAEEENINLRSIKGTGRQGQILKRDLEKAIALAGSEAATETGVRRVPATPMQQIIAKRTRQSKRLAPHFYADITVDMADALTLRQEAINWANARNLAAPSVSDLCLKAAALTLRDFPYLNASFQETEILLYPSINIGFVVGLKEGGMLVPVVHDADYLNLYDLAEITSQLKERADQGVLRDRELLGGTFTISNLGMYGLESFTAVINPPQAGILALGAVQEQPAVRDGIILPRPLMKATLSVDHRLVDGVVAARFMSAWKELLEKPSALAFQAPEDTVQ